MLGGGVKEDSKDGVLFLEVCNLITLPLTINLKHKELRRRARLEVIEMWYFQPKFYECVRGDRLANGHVTPVHSALSHMPLEKKGYSEL